MSGIAPPNNSPSFPFIQGNPGDRSPTIGMGTFQDFLGSGIANEFPGILATLPPNAIAQALGASSNAAPGQSPATAAGGAVGADNPFVQRMLQFLASQPNNFTPNPPTVPSPPGGNPLMQNMMASLAQMQRPPLQANMPSPQMQQFPAMPQSMLPTAPSLMNMQLPVSPTGQNAAGLMGLMNRVGLLGNPI